ncbi:MAG: FAD-dependent oxidoreductase [Brevundimonas sp.]|uniref:NAD(P)/FAD-dependent oxidoreductase n=1 Tax=Brevundimonas sp. TaxID=1871086 RepID=UPI00182DC40B|nr:FAD-dependent oxidoreductase [Brevundimonas sp.]MBA4805705.1 FAD-dependent oxidoreductase [Brevundimonas sp.]
MSDQNLAPGADRRLRIAVIGSGISSLSCAWLLSERHEVVVYERDERMGGHSHTVEVRAPGEPAVAVDMGFIVFNDATYPNLVALLDHLGVGSRSTEMSFAVSLEEGGFEYAAPALFAQRRNAFRPRFWSMLAEILRFYRDAPRQLAALEGSDLTLGEFLDRSGFSKALRDDHLLPMAAAIWSSPARTLLDYPAASFLRFCRNHGLLRLTGRPQWRTVEGGSRSYVRRLAERLGEGVRLARQAVRIRRLPAGVEVRDSHGTAEVFDHVVIGTHADQALALLEQPTPDEQALLGAFRYSRNLAVLHSDVGLMPRRRRAWASWNYLGVGDGLCVSYWMNRLQGLPGRDLFVTLNPPRPPRAETLLRSEIFEHPIFDAAAVRAQESLWSLQGQGGVWYCGAWFGAGFHEDGLQAGLAVAEALGGVRRPWTVANESGRIHLGPARKGALEAAA